MTIPLDEIDIDILQRLQENGRRSFSDIANELNIASNTVRNRVTRLQDADLLKIVGWVDPHVLGYRAPANIQITIEPPHLIEEAAAQLAELPEARLIALMTGEFDLYVNVRCRDMEHLTELVTKKINTIPGVVRTQTNMYMHVYKYGPSEINLKQHSAAMMAK